MTPEQAHAVALDPTSWSRANLALALGVQTQEIKQLRNLTVRLRAQADRLESQMLEERRQRGLAS